MRRFNFQNGRKNTWDLVNLRIVVLEFICVRCVRVGTAAVWWTAEKEQRQQQWRRSVLNYIEQLQSNDGFPMA